MKLYKVYGDILDTSPLSALLLPSSLALFSLLSPSLLLSLSPPSSHTPSLTLSFSPLLSPSPSSVSPPAPLALPTEGSDYLLASRERNKAHCSVSGGKQVKFVDLSTRSETPL